MRTLLAAALLGLLATTPVCADSALRQLLKEGETSHSDALVIWKDGKEIGHYYKGGKAPGPIELMSVTKSVVALGIGQLIDEGKITSLDQPVADFYPEWRQGRKSKITIRMLLNHTSGMQSQLTTVGEINPAPDAVQLALAAELTDPPGKAFFYNNKATNLLSGLISKASGKPMDVFFRDGLFKAMDIHPGPWETDNAGHPYGMAGLPLTAADLGKIGQLMLNKGNWRGRQLLSEAFVEAATTASYSDGYDQVGLLWWINPQWRHFDTNPDAFAFVRRNGVPDDIVATLENALKGGHYASMSAAEDAVFHALGPDGSTIFREQIMARMIGPLRFFKVTNGPAVAFSGNGDGGQYIVVVPAAHIVAVRQIRAESSEEQEGEGFNDFVDRVIAVANLPSLSGPASSPVAPGGTAP